MLYRRSVCPRGSGDGNSHSGVVWLEHSPGDALPGSGDSAAAVPTHPLSRLPRQSDGVSAEAAAPCAGDHHGPQRPQAGLFGPPSEQPHLRSRQPGGAAAAGQLGLRLRPAAGYANRWRRGPQSHLCHQQRRGFFPYSCAAYKRGVLENPWSGCGAGFCGLWDCGPDFAGEGHCFPHSRLCRGSGPGAEYPPGHCRRWRAAQRAGAAGRKALPGGNRGVFGLAQ